MTRAEGGGDKHNNNGSTPLKERTGVKWYDNDVNEVMIGGKVDCSFLRM